MQPLEYIALLVVCLLPAVKIMLLPIDSKEFALICQMRAYAENLMGVSSAKVSAFELSASSAVLSICLTSSFWSSLPKHIIILRMPAKDRPLYV